MEPIGKLIELDPHRAVERIRKAAATADRDAGLPPGPVAHVEPPSGGAGGPPSVPSRYRTPLADLEQTPAVTRALSWLEGPRDRGLLLVGPVGTGKSSIAGQIAVRAGAPFHAHYWPVRRLIEATKAEMDGPRARDGQPQRPVLDRVAVRDLLVLDDLGAERPTDYTRDLLGRIVEARYDADQLLVVTSNLPPAQLAEHIGSRAFSRLFEMCELVQVTGPDRRQQGSREER